MKTQASKDADESSQRAAAAGFQVREGDHAYSGSPREFSLGDTLADAKALQLIAEGGEDFVRR